MILLVQRRRYQQNFRTRKNMGGDRIDNVFAVEVKTNNDVR